MRRAAARFIPLLSSSALRSTSAQARLPRYLMSSALPTNMEALTSFRHNRIAISPPKGIPSLQPNDPRLSSEGVSALLDELRPLFSTTLRLQAIALPGRQLPVLTKNEDLVPFFFSAAGIRHVQPDPQGSPEIRILLLNVESGKALPAPIQSVLESHSSDLSLIPDFKVTLGWDNLTSDQVLETLLPSSIVQQEGVPTGFTIVGHIAHLNLLDVYLPFRFLVGHVILSKNASALRTVVNKLDTIDTEFRFFKMELLAGEPDFTAHVSESDCTFSFDFRTVYWNSRLHGEHMRLIRQFRPNQVVADVMAGVGPFALPAAKRGSWVLANDLNPSSYQSLVGNAKSNKVYQSQELEAEHATVPNQKASNKFNSLFDGAVTAFCIDGREFIRQSIVDTWRKSFRGRPKLASTPQQKEDTKLTDHEIVDEQVRLYGRNAVKQQQKRNRDLHAARKAAQSSSKQQLAEVQSDVATLSLSTKLNNGNEVPRHKPRKLVDHFVMNLPASALEFLDAYRGAYTNLATTLGPNGKSLVEAEIQRRATSGVDAAEEAYPMVHVHCFSKEPFRPVQDILARANAALGISPDAEWRLQGKPIQPPTQTLALARKSGTDTSSSIPSYLSSHPDYAQFSSMTSVAQMMQFLNEDWLQQPGGANASPDLVVHYVRDVAPNKQMYCLSFRLPPQVLWAT